MRSLVKSALIGCGRMGVDLEKTFVGLPNGWEPLAYAEAMASLEEIDLVALCDIDEDRLRSASATYGIDLLFTDHNEMLATVQPDLVVIATRTPGRCSIVRDCAENGVKAIHAEKPLGTNLTEIDMALDAVRRNGVEFSYGTLRRYIEPYRQCRNLVRAGAIGTLQHITIEHDHELLMWGHPHSTDLFLYYLDNPPVDYVQASCRFDPSAFGSNTLDADPLVENAFVAFADGTTGTITRGRGLNIRLSGTDGSLFVFGDGHRVELHRCDTSGSGYETDIEAVPIDARFSGAQTAIRELLAGMSSEIAPSISTTEVRQGMALIFSIAYSAIHDGRQVSPSEVPDDFTVTSRFNGRTA